MKVSGPMKTARFYLYYTETLQGSLFSSSHWNCPVQPHAQISAEFFKTRTKTLSFYLELVCMRGDQWASTAKETASTEAESKAESPFLSSCETKRVSKHKKKSFKIKFTR